MGARPRTAPCCAAGAGRARNQAGRSGPSSLDPIRAPARDAEATAAGVPQERPPRSVLQEALPSGAATASAAFRLEVSLLPRLQARGRLFAAAGGVHPRATARRAGRFLRLAALRRAAATQPLPLLDQLADLLATLVTNLRVELGTAAGAHALSALLADLLVELVPALRFDGLSALLADLLVEGASALLRDFHASLATRFGNRHPALLLVRHLLPPVVRKDPPSPPPSGLSTSLK